MILVSLVVQDLVDTIHVAAQAVREAAENLGAFCAVARKRGAAVILYTQRRV